MLTKLKGLSVTALSLIGVAIAFALVLHFQTFLLTKQDVLNQILIALLLITTVFAAQFNHSRLSLLTMVLLLFYATSQQLLPWSPWVKANHSWLVLTGANVILLLAFVKDRGLVSIHGLLRLVFIPLCGALSFGWLTLHEILATKLATTAISGQLLPYMPLIFPLSIGAMLLAWRSLTQRCLTLATLLAALTVWSLQHYQLLELPWVMTLTVLTLQCLLAVIINSYFLAYRDDLTSLPSRRALNQLALSLGRKYVVSMLDIDHFKKFNDTYGHDTGDEVLKLVAAKLAKVKGGGKVFRYGGEEFTIVFSGKTTEQAILQLEQLRQAIADYKIVVRQPQRKTKQARKPQKSDNHKTVSVTISIGVAQRQAKQSFEQALKDADLALYRAKKKGRNNVSQ